MREGSTLPERVAPGRPSSGVRPILDVNHRSTRGENLVSMDFPFWIAQAEAPDPKCNAIIDVLSTGYASKSEILEIDLLKI